MAPNKVGENCWTDRHLSEEGGRLTAIAVKTDSNGYYIVGIRARWKMLN